MEPCIWFKEPCIVVSTAPLCVQGTFCTYVYSRHVSLFCRISSFLKGSLAKETYTFEAPTHRSHPIADMYRALQRMSRALLLILQRMSRALLRMSRALLRMSRALLRMSRALLLILQRMSRALLRMSRALLLILMHIVHCLLCTAHIHNMYTHTCVCMSLSQMVH